MRSKRMLPLAALSALLVFCGGAFPRAAQAQVKIAVINTEDAIVGTKEGKKAIEDLKAKYAPKDAEFQKRVGDLQAKQEQYRKTENTISEDAKAALARDIDTTTKALQRDKEDMQADLDQDQQKLLSELGPKVMQTLQKYANEHQLTLVLDVAQQSNILFASNTVEITRDIIAMYDNAPPITNVAKPSANIAPAAPAPKPAAPKPAAPPPAK